MKECLRNIEKGLSILREHPGKIPKRLLWNALRIWKGEPENLWGLLWHIKQALDQRPPKKRYKFLLLICLLVIRSKQKSTRTNRGIPPPCYVVRSPMPNPQPKAAQLQPSPSRRYAMPDFRVPHKHATYRQSSDNDDAEMYSNMLHDALVQ